MFVYSADSNAHTITMFSVDGSTGKLHQRMPGQIPTSGSPIGLAVDPFSRFVFASNDNGTLDAYVLNRSSGDLTFAGTNTFSSGGGRTFAGAIDPTGHWLYVPVEGINKLLTFSINQVTGNLLLRLLLT